jgi:hypothetical protein
MYHLEVSLFRLVGTSAAQAIVLLVSFLCLSAATKGTCLDIDARKCPGYFVT